MLGPQLPWYACQLRPAHFSPPPLRALGSYTELSIVSRTTNDGSSWQPVCEHAVGALYPTAFYTYIDQGLGSAVLSLPLPAACAACCAPGPRGPAKEIACGYVDIYQALSEAPPARRQQTRKGISEQAADGEMAALRKHSHASRGPSGPSPMPAIHDSPSSAKKVCVHASTYTQARSSCHL